MIWLKNYGYKWKDNGVEEDINVEEINFEEERNESDEQLMTVCLHRQVIADFVIFYNGGTPVN